jgi:hypothetical protein
LHIFSLLFFFAYQNAADRVCILLHPHTKWEILIPNITKTEQAGEGEKISIISQQHICFLLSARMLDIASSALRTFAFLLISLPFLRSGQFEILARGYENNINFASSLISILLVSVSGELLNQLCNPRRTFYSAETKEETELHAEILLFCSLSPIRKH